MFSRLYCRRTAWSASSAVSLHKTEAALRKNSSGIGIVQNRHPQIARLFLITLFFCSVLQAAESTRPAKEFHDIVYKTVNGESLTLNLFLPAQNGETQKNLPLLIYLDSGCWHSEGPTDGGLWRRFGALEKGFAIASVSHRSMPKNIFPDQIEDVKAAVRFLRAHAQEYGLDAHRFASLGTSSGGHLSTMLGISDRYRLFDVGDHLDQSSQVQTVINFYSPADMPYALETSPQNAIDCFFIVLGAKSIPGKSYADQAPELLAAAKKYTVLSYVDENYAPTLTFQGVADPIVPTSQSCHFHEALLRSGVRTQLHICNTGVHTPESFGSDEELAAIIFNFLGW